MTSQEIVPNDDDILFGRGYAIQFHPGNVAFRSLVDDSKAEFKRKEKHEKRMVAIQIMQTMRQRNARFLTEDTTCKKKEGLDDIPSRTWVVVEDGKAVKKIMHRLREKEWVPKRASASFVTVEETKMDPKEESDDNRLDNNDGSHRRKASRDNEGGTSACFAIPSAEADARRPGGYETLDDISCDLNELGGNLPRSRHNSFNGGVLSVGEDTRDLHFNAASTLGPLRTNGTSNVNRVDPHESSLFEASWSQSNLQVELPLVGSRSSQNLQLDQSIFETPLSSLNLQIDLPSVEGQNLALDVEESKISSLPLSGYHDEGRSLLGEATEIQLRQWIDDHLPKGLYSWGELISYVKAAVLIAIELTEMLVREDESNPKISLRSCNEISIVLRGNQITGVVVVRNSVQLGSVTDRLASLGAIFYELFSGLTPSQKNEGSHSSAGTEKLDVDSIIDMLQNDTRRTKKRPDQNSHGSTNFCGDSKWCHNLMSSLDNIGLTSSLSGLIKNLISCSQSDFRVDEAYSSFNAVLADLKLVRNNPDCYLESIGDSPTFTIPHKLYGRQETMDKIASLYKCNTCSSLLVNGRAGVGKSSLLSHVFTSISEQDGSYFLQTKFEQAGTDPLATVASLFDALCEAFIRDAQPQVKNTVATELESAIGEAGVIALSSIVPSLSKISKNLGNDYTYQYMDRAATVRYCLGKLLQIISSRTPPIILLFDDLQFADDNSRLIVSSLLRGVSTSAFFVGCYRDDDVKPGDIFSTWLENLDACGMEQIEVDRLSAEGVNEMVSETLRAFPRITLPLSTQLHAKTRGNPLFLRQFIESLHIQGLIFLRLNPPMWAWDLERISNVELPVSVVALLTEEMRTLSTELIEGLRVVSCLGSTAKKETLDIISSRMDFDFSDALNDLVKKGYLEEVNGSGVRFSHDKVQQSAYETMAVVDQRRLHTRLGLILCDQVLLDDTLLFSAATQINLGGVDTSLDGRKRAAIAALNQKAGHQAKDLSAFDSALRFFQAGIRWVQAEERWSTDYATSLALHVSAVETACLLNNLRVVTKLTEEVAANAISDEDKIACLFCLLKSLATCDKLADCKNVGFAILGQLGGAFPRETGDPSLELELKDMIATLHNTADETIMSMEPSNTAQRDVLLLEVYFILMTHIYFECNPKCLPDTSLQMLRTTLCNGLSAISPLVLALFALTLVGLRQNRLAHRMSHLAKRLVTRPSSQMFTSAVAITLGLCVDWMFEPLESVAESLLNGHRNGLQVGDLMNARHNYRNYINYTYLGGQELSRCRDNFCQYIETCWKTKETFSYVQEVLHYRMCVSLIEGTDYTDSFPSWNDLSSLQEQNRDTARIQAHSYMRSFLFQTFDDGVMEGDGLLSRLRSGGESPLRPLFMIGVFYEGLLSFHLALRRREPSLISRGEQALEFIGMHSEANKFTFENKHLLLEASRMELSDPDQAFAVYQKAIESASVHRFPHEEALASELAGRCLFKEGMFDRAQAFYAHAIEKYQSWGAKAIVRRLGIEMQQKFSAMPSVGRGLPLNNYCVGVLNDQDDSSVSRKRSAA